MKFKIYLDTCEIKYNLTDTFTSECWFETFIKKTPDQASISYMTQKTIEKETPKLILELENLIEYLRSHDYKLDNFDKNNPLKSLQILHIHFPTNVKKVRENPKLHSALIRYNEVIHDLENHYPWIEKNFEHMANQIVLRFNNVEKYDIMEEDLNHFHFVKMPADIELGYCQAGKHFTELFYNRDMEIPDNQIDLFKKFSPSCLLHFRSTHLRSKSQKNIMEKFYYEFGEHRWKYKWGDPRLGAGRFILAIAESYDIEKINNCNKVIGWDVI